MLIAEQLMLLCIDPAAGAFEPSRNHVDMETLAAAAIILDLAEQGRLRINGEYLAIDTTLPLSHPQLAAATHALTGPPIQIEAAIELLAARLAHLPRQLLDSLFRRDVLHRTRAAWWPWSPLRYPLRSLQSRNEAIEQLRKATSSSVANLRGLGLLLLTDLAGRTASALEGATHEAAARKLLELGNVGENDAPAHRLIARIRTILLA